MVRKVRREFCQQLIVEEEFRRLEQPVEDDVQRALERELLENRCQNEINLWGHIILEGFLRYQLCLKHELPVRTRQIPVHNRREALTWACAAQLRRSDLKTEMRLYLIGKRYSIEKGVPGHHSSRLPGILAQSLVGTDETPVPGGTAIRLGKEYGFGRYAITRYGVYAESIDQLFRTAPQLAELILSGILEMTQKDVIRVSQLPEQVLRKAEESPEEFVIQNGLQRRRRGRPPAYDGQLSDSDFSQQMLVKQMPSYDPDAEVSGLTLTIPSWISSIQRTYAAAEFPAISPGALERLAAQLLCLTQSAEQLMGAIKEVL